MEFNLPPLPCTLMDMVLVYRQVLWPSVEKPYLYPSEKFLANFGKKNYDIINMGGNGHSDKKGRTRPVQVGTGASPYNFNGGYRRRSISRSRAHETPRRGGGHEGRLH